jgi:filamentous hemagglutinin family protein
MTRGYFRPRSALAVALPALLLAGALAGQASAATAGLPSGATVVAGKARVGTSTGFSLTIDQTSSKAVIDWNSFSIGRGDKVTFDNGSGITLNRVMGGQVSDIDGTLTATGGVYILNPNGVLIGKSGVINTGGDFVASSLALSNKAFLAGGDLSFTGVASGPVTNLGYIVSANGSLALIGPNVSNTGQMIAASGDVGLAAGEMVVLHARDADDGRLSVLVGGAGTSAENSGLIRSAEAELKANGGDIYALAPNPGTGIEAIGVSAKDGNVWLIATSGDVTASGSISAHSADGAGALVETSGEHVDFDGLKVDAGEWLIDPVTLTIDAAAATTIDANLATTNVVLQTTATSASGPGVQSSGAGDIIVAAPISWSSSKSLTLDAYHSIDFDADVSVAGAGQLVLKTSDGGTGGDYAFAPGASVSFAAGTGAGIAGQALTINGQAFTLIFTEAQLAAINADLAGDFALAGPLSLQGFVFTDAPIAHDVSDQFTGVFEGLGNSISNLVIDDTFPLPQTLYQYPANGFVGLFGIVGAAGVVRDISVVTASVTGGDDMAVGALAGVDLGTISNATSSGFVTVGSSLPNSANNANAQAGGLVGYVSEGGVIADSSSSASVAGGDAIVGGLVGGAVSGATVTGSSASGAVSVGSYGPEAAAAGGFAGIVYGYQYGPANPIQVTLANDYATGAVTGGAGSEIGGFVGLVTEGKVSTSYATGSVTQILPGIDNGQYDFAGGFVGVVGTGGSVTQSYASGAVTGVGGPVAGWDTFAGGFVGDLDQGATVTDSYALGAVSVSGGNSLVGGFAGLIQGGASATGVYATGAVSGNFVVGGLVGLLGDNDTAGSISDAYWDEGTTGMTSGYTLGASTSTATHVVGVGGDTGRSPYAASTYAYFDLSSTWFMIDGQTRPILRSEYSTDIVNAHQLQLMDLDLSADYTLAANIDASETSSASGVWNPANGFAPVGGNGAAAFTGVFEGAGDTISNLAIHFTTATPQTGPDGSTDGMVGLFGEIGAAGAVRDVTLSNVTVVAGDGMDVGGLVGIDEGTVTNAAVYGSVAGGGGTNDNTYIGGLAGEVIFGSVANSTSSSTVSGGADASVGGLVGTLVAGASITGSQASGGVAAGGGAGAAAGGLVGSLRGYNGTISDPVSISDSFAVAAVSGDASSYLGGLVGLLDNGNVATSYATGSVTLTSAGASGSFVGGFVGQVNSGSITEARSSGAVTMPGGADADDATAAGGFAGYIGPGASVTYAYSLSSVTATGSQFSVVGGFAGLVQGAVSQFYATGLVNGSGQAAGLIGDLLEGGSASDGYWDVGTTGQSTAVASGSSTSTLVALGDDSGPSPYAEASYANFDFSSEWYIIDGETRPILRSEYSTTITDAHQLELMGLDPGASYTLGDNIDASETASVPGVWNPANGFVPVGSASAPFTGTLNGAGFTISNLHITVAQGAEQSFEGLTTDGFAGLFGVVDGPSALIENVNLANVTVSGGEGVEVGALAGVVLQGAVENAASSGSVTGGDALIDANGNPINAAIGGLVGLMGSQSATGPAASITGSSSAASVGGGDAFVGGLVGSTLIGSSITGSSASGAVSVGSTSGTAGEIAVGGGLVGSIYGAVLSNDYATGAVSGSGGSAVGGFAGYIGAAQVSSSYATGAVSQAVTSYAFSNYAGGFAGYVDTGSAVTTSFASGAVNSVGSSSSPSTFAGGFAGYVNGAIGQAYATGAVASTGTGDDVGGFAGEIDAGGAVNQVYATGVVSGAGSVGGLAGQLSGALSNSYWDEGTTGQTAGYVNAGGDATNVVGVGGATGISPFEAATYAGWDFTQTWSEPSAGEYPELLGVSHVLELVGGSMTTVYGQLPVYTYQVLGIQDADIQYGDPIGEAPAGANYSTAGWIDVGTYALDPASVTAIGASGAYRSIYVPGSLTVTPAPVQVTLTGVVDKTYDGTTDATLSQSNLNFSGVLAGDDVVGAAESATYATKDAGTGIAVTASGLQLTGADAANYTVNATATASGGVGEIDPKTLTVTLGGTVEKTYDGTTSATLSASNYGLSGVIEGDTVALNDPTAGAYGSKNAGSGIAVTVSGLALSGAEAADYTVASSASANIGKIDPKALTASLIGTVTKLYDGTTTAVLTASNYQLTGVISGDSVTLNDPTTGAYATSQAGTGIMVTATGLALSGAGASNYTVNGAASAPIGVITAAAPVVTPGQVEIQVITPTQVETFDQPLVPPEDAAAAGLAEAAGGQAAANPTAYTVFPLSQGAAAAATGDSSPVTGAGNGDLWVGSNLDPDQVCPSSDQKSCKQGTPNR